MSEEAATLCHKCTMPMKHVVHFSDGSAATACERHYHEHMNRAERRRRIVEAERDVRIAVEEVGNALAAEGRAWAALTEAKKGGLSR